MSVTATARIIAAVFASLIAFGVSPARAEELKVRCIKANADAQSFRREGRLSDAREQLEMCGSPACPSLVSADCIKRLDELERAQPTVVFNVVDGQGRDLNEVRVTVDGRELLQRLEGVAVEVDLGAHEVTFSAPDRPSVTQKLVFREGEKARIVRVTLAGPNDARGRAEPTLAGAGSSTAATDEGAGREAGPAGSSRRVLGYAVGGLGLAGLAVGGVFGYRAIQAKNRQIEHCTSKASCPDYVKAAEANQDAKLAGVVSTVAFVAGVAMTSLGVVLVLTGPSQGGGAEPTAVELAPSFGRNTAGLAVSGTW
jgi:hypothetical protein